MSAKSLPSLVDPKAVRLFHQNFWRLALILGTATALKLGVDWIVTWPFKRMVLPLRLDLVLIELAPIATSAYLMLASTSVCLPVFRGKPYSFEDIQVFDRRLLPSFKLSLMTTSYALVSLIATLLFQSGHREGLGGLLFLQGFVWIFLAIRYLPVAVFIADGSRTPFADADARTDDRLIPILGAVFIAACIIILGKAPFLLGGTYHIDALLYVGYPTMIYGYALSAFLLLHFCYALPAPSRDRALDGKEVIMERALRRPARKPTKATPPRAKLTKKKR